MWKSVSRKSILVYGLSALLAFAIACGGTANGDATASPAQEQSNQSVNTQQQPAPSSTQVGMPAPSEEVTVPTFETQQAGDSASVAAPAPVVSGDTQTVVPSSPAPKSAPSQGATQGSAPLATQDPAPAPAQPVAPSSGAAPVQTTPAPSLAPSTQVDPAPVAPPAPPVQVAPVAELDAFAIVAAQEEVFTDLYENVLPSVAKIEVSQMVQGQLTKAGEGSGFVWDVNGVIVTNNHVVEGSDAVLVIFEDGNEFQARILGTDPESDLAALQIDAPAGYLKPVSLGDNNELKVGQLTFAIGNPFGKAFTMTAGIVSALGRTIEGAANSPYQIPSVIQTDASINPGNSGGPLFDVRGNVIGINSQIISQSGASAGIGFAIPINIAKIVVPELIATGSHRYTYLGISGGSVTSLVAERAGLDRDTRGVIITLLTAGGPAGKAGLLAPQGNNRGDIITSIDGLAVRTIEDLIAYLAENTIPGQTIVVEVIRPNGSVESIGVLLEPRPGS